MNQQYQESSRVYVGFYMTVSHWAFLYIHVFSDWLDNGALGIRLANGNGIFESMIGWLRAIKRGDERAEFEIDEEGVGKRLAIEQWVDDDRVKFTVRDSQTDYIQLNTLVERQALVAEFKRGLTQFFDGDFDPLEWDFYDDHRDGYDLLERMRNDPWLRERESE